jgi:hypothetical protein
MISNYMSSRCTSSSVGIFFGFLPLPSKPAWLKNDHLMY